MRSQTFEQKRIVELSKELDQERNKNERISKESRQQYQQIQSLKTEDQKSKSALADLQTQLHKVKTQLQREKAQGKILNQEKAAIERTQADSALEGVRQRQKVEKAKGDMAKYQAQMKELLYQKEKEITVQEKQNFTLREENIETEKLYLKKRQEFQRKEENQMRNLTKTLKELQALRKQLQTFTVISARSMENQRAINRTGFEKVASQLQRLQIKVKQENIYKEQIAELHIRIEQVVSENSQKIIQLYKCKNF